MAKGRFFEKFVFENTMRCLWGRFFMQMIGNIFDGISQAFPHFRRQIVAVVLFQNVPDTAFARLAVDADNIICLVLASHVVRVDGQIGNGPLVQVLFLHAISCLWQSHPDDCRRRHGEDQRARIGVRSYSYMRVTFSYSSTMAGMLEKVQLRVYAQAVHVHGHGDNITLPVRSPLPNKSAFHAVSSGQKAHFGVSDAAAAVIIAGAETESHFTVLQVVVHVLDLVGINMAHAHGHCHRQIDDDGFFFGRLQYIQNGVANFQCVLGFRAGKAFRAVLKAKITFVFAGQLFDELGSVRGDLLISSLDF